MARKANSKTPSKELIRDIMGDQLAIGIPHLSNNYRRTERLAHNVTELYHRLGETVEVDDILYYC